MVLGVWKSDFRNAAATAIVFGVDGLGERGENLGDAVSAYHARVRGGGFITKGALAAYRRREEAVAKAPERADTRDVLRSKPETLRSDPRGCVFVVGGILRVVDSPPGVFLSKRKRCTAGLQRRSRVWDSDTKMP